MGGGVQKNKIINLSPRSSNRFVRNFAYASLRFYKSGSICEIEGDPKEGEGFKNNLK